ncbi:unnamed protein product [Urochloa humidicola]
MAREGRLARKLSGDMIWRLLLHIPPHHSEVLLRASAACKEWRRIITEPAFTRSYRALHGTPPLLGYFCNEAEGPSFIPATPFRPSAAPPLPSNCVVVDSRHGRVLVLDRRPLRLRLFLWFPTTGRQISLPRIPPAVLGAVIASVLCAAGANCDHGGCHAGPFRVALVCIKEHGEAKACLYASETGAWSEPAFLDDIAAGTKLPLRSAALVGDALYHACEGDVILRYDLTTLGLSAIPVPQAYQRGALVIPAEDEGGLGFVCLDSSGWVHVWSTKTTAGIIRWDLRHSLQLPESGDMPPRLIGGFLGGAGRTIFLKAPGGQILAVDLESAKMTALYSGVACDLYPYRSFCIPNPC